MEQEERPNRRWASGARERKRCIQQPPAHVQSQRSSLFRSDGNPWPLPHSWPSEQSLSSEESLPSGDLSCLPDKKRRNSTPCLRLFNMSAPNGKKDRRLEKIKKLLSFTTVGGGRGTVGSKKQTGESNCVTSFCCAFCDGKNLTYLNICIN